MHVRRVRLEIEALPMRKRIAQYELSTDGARALESFYQKAKPRHYDTIHHGS